MKEEVKIEVMTVTQPDAVRIEVLISGANEAKRHMVSELIKEAIDVATKEES